MPKIRERAMLKTYERESFLKTMNANPGNSLHRKGNAQNMRKGHAQNMGKGNAQNMGKDHAQNLRGGNVLK